MEIRSIDDCARVLVQGLSDCKQIQSLNLRGNIISDDGLDVLNQGLPASVNMLDLTGNEVTLARKIPLLRFKELVLLGNTLSLDGPRDISASFSNPECRLESLDLTRCNIGNDGAATLAEGLSRAKLAKWKSDKEASGSVRSKGPLRTSQNIWEAMFYVANISQDVEMMFELNSVQDKGRVAVNKILQVDIRPFFGMELDLLPYVVAWLDRFAESCPNLKLSSIYEFVRAMPTKVTNRVGGKTEGEKRNLNS
ncbi:hypothetical protein THAOC_08811 [Thalassiosira oceanica]|uniref:Uncharacterized protein n=1 Tax=Thalassiosira oceanica TaxID=159749 RepID=K0T905_THAOC|nr:hypothetical protein THAOC_08811 [Thalassiosira oceanica]|eukprot:EJK69891.1 hypothetical protein THAOC_08811 [Thalassiosira oceanica]